MYVLQSTFMADTLKRAFIKQDQKGHELGHELCHFISKQFECASTFVSLENSVMWHVEYQMFLCICINDGFVDTLMFFINCGVKILFLFVREILKKIIIGVSFFLNNLAICCLLCQLI